MDKDKLRQEHPGETARVGAGEAAVAVNPPPQIPEEEGEEREGGGGGGGDHSFTPQTWGFYVLCSFCLYLTSKTRYLKSDCTARLLGITAII